jgi:hypothetical protein
MATIDPFSTMKPLEQMFYIFVQIIFNNFQTKIVFKEVSLDLFANDEFYKVWKYDFTISHLAITDITQHFKTNTHKGYTTTSVQHGKILIYCGSDVIFELLLKTYNYTGVFSWF